MEGREEKYRKALEEIALHQMPKMTILKYEVTLENMTDLCQLIQDITGIAHKALEE